VLLPRVGAGNGRGRSPVLQRADRLPRNSGSWLGRALVGVGNGGGALLLYYARIASRCDCPFPPCYTRPARPDCDRLLTEHAYTWLGVIALVSAVVSCVFFLWLARKVDRPTAAATLKPVAAE
jgi:hypothetical protein